MMVNTRFCGVELAENGRLLVVTLDRPPDNAVVPEMLDEIALALDLLAAGNGPELAILTGRGTCFSKGFDLSVPRSHAGASAHAASLVHGNNVCSRIAESPKPIIAAIQGACLGAGLELALACHVRLCGERSRLGLPELSQGLIPGLGGVTRLVQLVGRSKALEMMITGDLLSSDDALRVGLVQRVLPRDGFAQAVRAFAGAILAVDPALVREVVRLVGRVDPLAPQASVLNSIISAVRVAAATKSSAGK